MSIFYFLLTWVVYNIRVSHESCGKKRLKNGVVLAHKPYFRHFYP